MDKDPLDTDVDVEVDIGWLIVGFLVLLGTSIGLAIALLSGAGCS